MKLRSAIFFLFLGIMLQSVVRADGPNATILLYHGLTENCPESIYEKRKDRFYRDMEYIRDNFDVISLSELQDIIENKKTLVRNTVVITFDDGMLSNYTIAAPILKEFGFPATFFIISDFPDNDDDFMTWEQIRELSQVTIDGDYPFTIGSHSCSHQYPGLQNLTGDALRRELEDSKLAIEQHIAPLLCTTFALPYGIFPPNQIEFRNLATDLGYELIRTSEAANIDIETDELFNLPCLPLYDFTEPEYIGAFNETPIETPFFDPPQDVYLQNSPASFDVPVMGITSYFSGDSRDITIEAIPENNDIIESVQVIHQSPWDVATIRITTKEGVFGQGKINLRLSEPGTYPSSGYFYVNVSARATILLYQGLTEKTPVSMDEKRKDRFYSDMEYIRDHFDVISLTELQDVIENQKPLQRNSVVITFDGGLISDYTIAAPILEEFGFPATFFVITDLREDKDYMNWEQIRELSQVTVDGEYLFNIGSNSHTKIYPGLQNLTGDALKYELEVSKNLIEEHISPRLCNSFSIPYGILPDDDDSFFKFAEEVGYEIIRSTRTRNIDIANDWLLYLPCLPLYDFTEPEYIGAFNQSSVTTTFFDPPQDTFSHDSPASFDVPVSGITSYFSGDSRNISIEAVPENNDIIESVQVIHQAPWDTAFIRITTKEGVFGQAKINLRLIESGTHSSSGYFYVNVSARATILFYQGLSENTPVSMDEKRKDRFYSDMEYIRDHFNVISLTELQDIMENQKPLSRNTVIITFDDGLNSVYTIAAPILEEFGFPATFFVITDSLENENYMNWEQIRELSQVTVDGNYLFTIGSKSHTHSRQDWPDIKGIALKRELEVSKDLIEEHISPRLCTTFALPYGILPDDEDSFYNFAEELGYEIIRSTRRRNIDITTDWLFNLPCLPLYDFTEPDYIGVFNQNPLPTPFFDPVQDMYFERSYNLRTPITGIYLDTPSGNADIVIEAVTDNHEIIRNLRVEYTPPQDEAIIRIEINYGIVGRAKINLKVSAPGAHPSSGYFYVNVEHITSVNPPEHAHSDISVFPNPATDRIEIKNADDTVLYKIYSITGNLVLAGRGNKIDVSAFPQGVYILAIDHEDNGVTILKFVKNK